MNDDELLPLRARLVAAAAAVALVALGVHQTSRIFVAGHDAVPLMAAVIVAGVAMCTTAAGAWYLRAPVIVALTVGGMVVGVVSANGALPGDLIDAPLNGISDIVSTIWPSPVRPTGVAVLGGLGCLAAALAADFAQRPGPGRALVAPVVYALLVALLSADAGIPPVWWMIAFVLVALALFRAHAPQRSRLNLALAIVVALVAASLQFALPGFAEDDRYDPRESLGDETPTDFGVSPLARVDEWRSREPDTTMFSTSDAEAGRWRLVALTRFDGQSWLPADDYRFASGAVTDASADGRRTVEVVVGALDAPWLPTVDRLIAVDRDVRIDGSRNSLLTGDGAPPSGSYVLTVVPADVQVAQLAGARATSPVPPLDPTLEIPSDIAEIATAIAAGATTDVERAARLASYLRDQFALDQTTPPGHSLAAVEVFLERSRRGRDEQFIAAFALMASSIGLPSRISVGFETVVGDTGTTFARASGATAWPEIEFEGFGWVAFDPVPTSETISQPSPGAGGIAPIGTDEGTPPVTTTPAPDVPVPTEEPTSTVPEGAESVSYTTAVLVAGGAAGLVVLIFGYVAVIWWLKRRRREARRTDPAADRRAVGALLSSVDTLVDLGGNVRPSATDHELVSAAIERVGPSATLLTSVADASTAAVYSDDPLAPAQADDSWERLSQVESNLASDVGRWRAFRARSSIRSLRRGLKP